MKKVTLKEFESLDFKVRKQAAWKEALKSLKVNEGLIISKEDRGGRESVPNTNDLKPLRFSCRKLNDGSFVLLRTT